MQKYLKRKYSLQKHKHLFKRGKMTDEFESEEEDGEFDTFLDELD